MKRQFKAILSALALAAAIATIGSNYLYGLGLYTTCVWQGAQYLENQTSCQYGEEMICKDPDAGHHTALRWIKTGKKC